MNSKLTSPSGIGIIRIIVNSLVLIILSKVANYASVGLFLSTYLVGEVVYLLLCGGLREALGKMIGARNYRGFHGNAAEVLRLAVAYSILVCLVVCLLCFFVNKLLALIFFRYSINASLFMYMSVYFTVRCARDVLAAYHKGKGNLKIGLLSDLVGFLGMLVSSFFIIKLVYGYGLKVEALLKNPLMDHLYGAIGLYICACIGNVLAIVLLVLTLFIKRRVRLTEEYKVIRGVDNRRNVFSNIIRIGYKDVARRITLVVGLCLIICIYLHNCCRTGMSDAEAYSNLGLFIIQYVLFLYVPLGFIMDFIFNCGKVLQGDMESDDIKSLKSNFSYSLKNILFLILPILLIYLVLGKKLLIAFLGNDLSTPVWLQGGSFALLFLSIALFGKTIMRIIHYEKMSMIIELAGLLVAVFTMIIISRGKLTPALLVTSVNIAGLALAAVYLYMLFRLIRFNIVDFAFKTLRVIISGIIMAVLLLIGSKIFVSSILWLSITIAAAYIIYVIAAVLIKGVLRKDINFLKYTLLYYPIKYMYSLLGQKF